MKKLLTVLFLFVSVLAFSQNNGINFQGVGRNSSGAVLASTKISLRFSVIQSSETGTVEYIESKEVTTNAQGIFSVVIGDGTQISKTGNFSDINWKINPKFLKVEMDPAGGSSFVAMGTTRLQAVPFAYYANGVNADNVDGVLSASKGGTGVASIAALKTALAIDQINNTSDLAKPISTATQAALDTKVSTATFSTTVAAKANVSDLDLKAPIDSPTFTGTVAGITKAMVGLGSVDNTSDIAKPISTLTKEALDTKVSTSVFSTTVATKANTSDLALKAPIDSPTFTGTVAGITKAMVGLGSVNNTSDLAKPISTATQEALDTKVSASTFSTSLATKVDTETFSLTIATKENAANKSTATDLGAGSTSDILFPTQKAVKTYVDGLLNSGGVQDGGILTRHIADLAVTNAKVATGIDKAKVGLDNVDNTTDLAKPISTATQEALDTKVSTSTFSATVASKANTSDLDLKAPINSPTFTGTVAGITKAMVGLGSVDNTSDLAKPISTATQEALDTKVSSATFSTTVATKANTSDLTLKAPIDSPTFTGTVAGITKAMVGLGSVDNTSDLAKPISTATQEALDTKVSTSTFSNSLSTKEVLSNKSTATDLGGANPSDELYPSQKAVKAYIAANNTSGGISDGSILTRHLADGIVTGAKISSSISGYKKFSDGAGNVIQSNAITPDQEVPHGQLKSGGTSLWQSFTAGVSGKLWQIEFETINPSTINGPAPEAYVEIYNGVGISGTRLGFSTNVGISGAGRSWKAFDLSPWNVEILSGNSYTARLIISGSNQDWVFGGESTYNLGISNVSSTWDHNIKTNLKPYFDDPYLTVGVANNLYGGLVSNATHTGDVSGSSTLTISDGAVNSSKISEGAVLTAKLADGSVTSTKIGIGAVDLTTHITGMLPSANINDGAIITSKIANSAVDLTSKVSGLLPTSNIADGAMTTAKIANSAVDLTTKVTGLLPTSNIADGAISTAKIANSAVDLTSKVTGLLPTSNIADGAISTVKLANSAVDLTTKVTGVLPTLNIADGAITTAKIANSAVDLTSKVTGQLSTSNIANGAITTAKIANSAVDLTSKVSAVLPTVNGGTGTATATSNTFFAAPDGTNGSPVFRSILAADLPFLTTSYISNSSSSIQNADFNISGNGIINGNMTATTGNFSNTIISGNSSVGSLTSSNDISVNNIEIGRGPGLNNSNLKIGNYALGAITTGVRNIAIGEYSLNKNTYGLNNLAIGESALKNNISADANIALGTSALLSNTFGTGNFAAGIGSLEKNISGDYNIAIGALSLSKNTVGFGNVALGVQSLYLNDTGRYNIALGTLSSYGAKWGDYNFSAGYESLYNNDRGSRNIAIGFQSMYNNSVGGYNISLGDWSLFKNDTSHNIALGYSSLYNNVSGEYNIAIGKNSLEANTEGDYNIAIGERSSIRNTSGEDNIAIGRLSMQNNTTGYDNVVIGYGASSGITGTRNIVIGYLASSSRDDVSNQITLGNNGITSLRAQVTSITALSDRRDKTDILTISEGIDFIKKLKPVSFTWNTRDKAKVGLKSAGFIAQDLLSLQKSSPIGENLDLVSEDNPEKLEARYNNLLPVMVKAIQDQQAIIEELKKELEAVKKFIHKP